MSGLGESLINSGWFLLSRLQGLIELVSIIIISCKSLSVHHLFVMWRPKKGAELRVVCCIRFGGCLAVETTCNGLITKKKKTEKWSSQGRHLLRCPSAVAEPGHDQTFFFSLRDEDGTFTWRKLTHGEAPQRLLERRNAVVCPLRWIQKKRGDPLIKSVMSHAQQEMAFESCSSGRLSFSPAGPAGFCVKVGMVFLFIF